MSDQEVDSRHEVVGIFHDADDFQDAIDDLLKSGFHRAELSLLASETAVTKKLGRHYQRTSELADDPKAPRVAYVSTEAIGDAEGALIGGLVYVGATATAGAVVASGGTLALAIGATALASGAAGLIGSFLAKWVGDHHGRYLQEQIDRGGLLLWVHARNLEHEERAFRILKSNCGDDVHVRVRPKGE